MFSATWPTSVECLDKDFVDGIVRILVRADELNVEVLTDTKGKEWKLFTTSKDLVVNGHNNTSKDKIILLCVRKKLKEYMIFCCVCLNSSQLIPSSQEIITDIVSLLFLPNKQKWMLELKG
ncbi:hypothetical protein MJO28_000902 [Puccinia striiformis f. sp. tritici]|uniref:Uncharacterized protein n=1 Tax=Puccinia striiformis f. sp. tritici TaxID=168172 RepID=A0ACC0F0X9_9BASI|nr:hypothetical protein MJO28_000902 [Puccinia striiformis f. sp. tritici]